LDTDVIEHARRLAARTDRALQPAHPSFDRGAGEAGPSVLLHLTNVLSLHQPKVYGERTGRGAGLLGGGAMKRLCRLVPVAAGAVLCSALTVVPASGAATLPRPVDCPTYLPTGQAVKDLQGTGWTVDSGTTPAPFRATVLGRLTDGIMPGVDLIMAKLSAPALTAAGGVWEGMSGSPVYAPDGRLIGAVAYTLAPSTQVAGITPAQEMAKLMFADPDGPTAAVRGRDRIRPGGSGSEALRRAGVPAAQAAQGFVRLPVPVRVAGATSAGGSRLLERLRRRTGQRVAAGGSSAGGTASAGAIFGGGNFAVAASSGDGALTAVGTTTFTCKGRAVAFGHPFLGTGVSTMSVHDATAVYVQPDPVDGPSKIADTGGVAGTLDRDRLFGVRARLGAGPRATVITSRLTRLESKATRVGRTTAVYAPLAADVAAAHVLNNVELVLGGFASTGTARVTLTVTGHRAGGRTFSLRHSDVFTAVTQDGFLDEQVGLFVADTVFALQSQPFERVSLDTVNLTGTISSHASTWGAPRVQVKRLGTWVPASRTVVAKGGAKLWTRTVLTAFRDPSVHSTVKVPLAVPRKASGHSVNLTVTGGGGDELEDPSGPAEASSFDGVLAQLRDVPRQDAVTVQLVDDETEKVYASRTARATRGVDGFALSFGGVVH
jgi:hypothetical protein